MLEINQKYATDFLLHGLIKPPRRTIPIIAIPYAIHFRTATEKKKIQFLSKTKNILRILYQMLSVSNKCYMKKIFRLLSFVQYTQRNISYASKLITKNNFNFIILIYTYKR